jgi:hypothetical protein
MTVALDRRFDVHRTRLGMTKNIGDPLLNDAIDGLGEDDVDIGQAAIDAGSQTHLRRLRPGVLQQRFNASFEPQFLDVERPETIQDAAVRLLQRFGRLQNSLGRGIELRFSGRNGFQQRHGIGPDAKQQRAELVMKLSRQIAAFVVLQRYDLAQQVSIVVAYRPNVWASSLAFFAASAYLRRSGYRDQIVVITLPKSLYKST